MTLCLISAITNKLALPQNGLLSICLDIHTGYIHIYIYVFMFYLLISEYVDLNTDNNKKDNHKSSFYIFLFYWCVHHTQSSLE